MPTEEDKIHGFSGEDAARIGATVRYVENNIRHPKHRQGRSADLDQSVIPMALTSTMTRGSLTTPTTAQAKRIVWRSTQFEVDSIEHEVIDIGAIPTGVTLPIGCLIFVARCFNQKMLCGYDCDMEVLDVAD